MHIILMAENGENRRGYSDEHPVDVILMDVHMPEMDGLEATRTLGVRNHDAVIIALIAGRCGGRQGALYGCGNG